jgi:flavin reductase (DIM6/NTAB) family NADH-FMN oxidoreductase RutF
MFIDLRAADADWRAVYKLCIGFINPRPIALVSTVSPHGRTNLAPFSFYNMVSGNPPVVMFCPALRRDGGRKDTLRNVEQMREFVVATATVEIARQMVACGVDLPPDQSEFEFSGLTPAPARRVRPPLVKEALVNIECTLRQIISFGDHGSAGRVVFGDIVALHIRDEIVTPDGSIDPHKLHTVGRMGGAWYCTIDRPYEMQLPKV